MTSPLTADPSNSPLVQNREQLELIIENIVQLQLEHARLRNAQEKEIATVRQKFRVPLAEVERYLLLETSWVEAWAQQHPDCFGEARSITCTHAVIGYRVTPPRVERASRKWNWCDIATQLSEIAWGRRYLRQPALEVNKEALLADRAQLLPAELRLVGLKIMQDERFYIAPHQTIDSPQPDLAWQDSS